MVKYIALTFSISKKGEKDETINNKKIKANNIIIIYFN